MIPMKAIDADALLDEVIDRHCNDCDRRKGIKNGKYRIIYSIGEAPCRACDVDDLKDEIEDAPTIELEQKWIPCSERMPEKGQKCLVCDKGAIVIDTFIGNGKPYDWKWYVRDYEAWIPLPEPYKEPKKCDTCQHEKEPWSMQCHRCENFNLWEAKQ